MTAISIRSYAFAACVLLAAAAPVLAQSADEKAAMNLCDEIAGTPLLGIAGVPERYTVDISMRLFSAVSGKPDPALYATFEKACTLAAATKDAHPRFRYQAARLTRAYETLLGKSSKEQADIRPLIQEYAKLGWPDALFQVGLSDWVKPGSAAEKLERLVPAARAGQIQAIDFLLRFYLQGWAEFKLPPDPQKAVELLEILAKGAPETRPPRNQRQAKATNSGEYSYAASQRYNARITLAETILSNPGFSAEQQAQSIATLESLAEKGDLIAQDRLAMAYRNGTSVKADPAKAFAIYEAMAKGNPARDGSDTYEKPREDAVTAQAEMLLEGTLGAPNALAARTLLETPAKVLPKFQMKRIAMLIQLYTEGKVLPREPLRAKALFESLPARIEAPAIQALGDYVLSSGQKPIGWNYKGFHFSNEARKSKADALRLALLLQQNLNQFDKPDELLKRLWSLPNNDTELRLNIIRAALPGLKGPRISGSLLQAIGLTPDNVREELERGLKEKLGIAFLLKGELSRAGAIYPQDTRDFILSIAKAGDAGNLEALVMLAELYQAGEVMKKSPEIAAKLLRRAAKAGHLEARRRIASSFTFNDAITPREALIEGIALAANREGGGVGQIGILNINRFTATFNSPRLGKLRIDEAVPILIDAMRYAPAVLEEEALVDLGKQLGRGPLLALEKALVASGDLKQEPDGFLGPEARAALRRHVEKKGPLLTIYE